MQRNVHEAEQSRVKSIENLQNVKTMTMKSLYSRVIKSNFKSGKNSNRAYTKKNPQKIKNSSEDNMTAITHLIHSNLSKT